MPTRLTCIILYINTYPFTLYLELASQIADEAIILCTHHRFNVVTVVGGTNMGSDQKAIVKNGGVDIIIGTPGRMLAHLEETEGFAEVCKQTKVLIFDE